MHAPYAAFPACRPILPTNVRRVRFVARSGMGRTKAGPTLPARAPGCTNVREASVVRAVPRREILVARRDGDEKLIEICEASVGVVPLQCDEIDNAGILRRELTRVRVARQSVGPPAAGRQQPIYRLRLAMAQPVPRLGGRIRRRQRRRCLARDGGLRARRRSPSDPCGPHESTYGSPVGRL